MCMMYNIDINEAVTYKLHNMDLTDNQIIMHYRPDLAKNILGELVPNPFSQRNTRFFIITLQGGY